VSSCTYQLLQIVLDSVALDSMEVTISTLSSLVLPDGSAKGKVYATWTISLPDGDVNGRTGELLHI
jgi:hypothetical protein